MDRAPAGSFTAVIGDLVASSSSSERAQLQERLLEAVADTEAQLADDLAARLVVTAGDELQGLLRPGRAAAAMALVRRLTDALRPASADGRRRVGLPVRFGLGHGGLATGPAAPDALARTSPAVLDGACFHRAREALEEARKAQRWVVARGFLRAGEEPGTAACDAVLDGLLALMASVRAGWTATQAEHIAILRRLLEERGPADGALPRGLRQRVAEEVDKNPSVITHSLQASAFEEVLAGEHAARRLLQAFEDGDAGAPNGSAS